MVKIVYHFVNLFDSRDCKMYSAVFLHLKKIICYIITIKETSFVEILVEKRSTHQPKRRIMLRPRTSILSIVVYIFDDREIRRNLS